MRLLLLSFYYPPDLCAGSFRAAALVEALQGCLGSGDAIDVVTTMPNRYSAFRAEAASREQSGQVSIHRIALPSHQSGFFDQAKAFSFFLFGALRATKGERYDLVVATSSRLFTATLGAVVARRAGAPLYLDIRDLFVDTMRSLLRGSLRWVALPLFGLLERLTFRSAQRINLVSEGFVADVERIAPQATLSVYTNGIDDLFLQHDFSSPTRKDGAPVTICYAGNLGQGQGMERIVPELARLLGDGFRFEVIGAGGMRQRFAELSSGIDQIVLRDPVAREELIACYRQADILFLHLNDCPAFEKVLPSKVFEYAATGKPILAGVRGAARAFLQREVPGAYCFDPGDANEAARLARSIPLEMVDRKAFVNRFSRRKIMHVMAEEMLATVAKRFAPAVENP